MKATITNKVFYESIPSASGIEVVGDAIFVIGDDSPYLYQLNKKFEQTAKHALADVKGFESGRVAKDEKMDLESIAAFERKGKPYLLILGSGASEARMKAFVVEFSAEGSVDAIVSYSVEKLYKQLQENEQVVGKGLLNIEGATVENGKLYLMHRAVAKEPNVLLEYDLEEFMNALKGDAAVPKPVVYHYDLSEIEGYQAGFSGADIFDNKLFFTASVEQTEDAIADGEVLGSYLGFIELDAIERSDKATSPHSALIVSDNGSTFKGKAESLVVSAGDAPDTYKVLVVTDDDQGHSELLEVMFKIE